MKLKDNGCIYCDRGNNGLMICCERCENWYHYRCVNKKWDLGLRRSYLNCLSEYYCYPCRKANPSLKLKYFSSENLNRNCITTRSDRPSKEHFKTFKIDETKLNQHQQQQQQQQNSKSATTTTTTATNTNATTNHHNQRQVPKPVDYAETSQSSTTSSSSEFSDAPSSSSTSSSTSTTIHSDQHLSAAEESDSSSIPKSDDTVENKQPVRTKQQQQHIPQQANETHSVSGQPQPHSHHQTQPQDSHNHPGPAIRNSDKIPRSSNKFKHKSSRLRSKVEKEWRRQRLPNL